jgi:hypothetical protein
LARALVDQPLSKRKIERQLAETSSRNTSTQIGGLVAQQLLQGQVLCTFTADELSVGNKIYETGDIAILAAGIKVQLR